ncbi:MAG: helicase-related protein, partial [Pseudomonadota bacterium]
QLERDGITATSIHGDKSQPQRTQALAEFKQGTVRALVATDVAARGLDIEDLPHVVNFELPTTPEDYIHRIGRTGRAGTKGDAISLVCEDENELLEGIEKLLKFKLKVEIAAGFEPGTTHRKAESVHAAPAHKRHEQAKPESKQRTESHSGRSNETRPIPRSEGPAHGQAGRSRAPQDPLFTQPYTPSSRPAAGTTTLPAATQEQPAHSRHGHQKKPLPALFMPPLLDKSKQNE